MKKTKKYGIGEYIARFGIKNLVVAICGKITQNYEINCDNPLQGGTNDKMVLINWDDWQDAVVTADIDNPQLIESIDLPSGVTGYLVEGKNNSINPKSEMVKQRFAELFKHSIDYLVFKIDAGTKDDLEKKVQGRFVAITWNRYKGDNGETSFEIYGKDAGMVLQVFTRDTNATDNQGAWVLQLATDEFSLEPHLPASLFDTDYTTTKAIFDSLYVA